jgi:hypothetical protein
VRRVARDLRSPRPLSGLELGPPDQGSFEGPVARAAASPGCAAVAFLARGYLARAGLGR